jgi:hypothetical protein
VNTDVVERVPQWAVTYLEYGDDSSLEPHDKVLVDRFVDKLLKEGFRLVAPVDGSESEFEPHPAFGLACETVDYIVEILEKHHEKRKDS